MKKKKELSPENVVPLGRLNKPEKPIINRLPECVYLELFWVSKSSRTKELFFHLVFNQQTKQIFRFGRVKFGIHGGELRLNIRNGMMPLESRQFDAALPEDFEIETEVSKSSGYKEGTGVSSELSVEIGSLQPKLGASGGYTESSEKQKGSSHTDRYKYTAHQVTAKGSPEEPVWVFQAIPPGNILVGALKRKKLGKVVPLKEKCFLQARFEVPPKKISISEVDGFLPQGLIQNKKSIINLLIIKSITQGFGCNFSEGELTYD